MFIFYSFWFGISNWRRPRDCYSLNDGLLLCTWWSHMDLPSSSSFIRCNADPFLVYQFPRISINLYVSLIKMFTVFILLYIGNHYRIRSNGLNAPDCGKRFIVCSHSLLGTRFRLLGLQITDWKNFFSRFKHPRSDGHLPEVLHWLRCKQWNCYVQYVGDSRALHHHFYDWLQVKSHPILCFVLYNLSMHFTLL